MNEQHLDALVNKSGPNDKFGRNRAVDINGVAYWSDGHFAIRADYPGRDQPGLVAIWAKAEVLPCYLPVFGTLTVSGRTFFRGVTVNGNLYFIDEAFRRAFIAPESHLSEPVNGGPFSIRNRDGEMVAVVMPLRGPGRAVVAEEPTDAEVFANFATEYNGHYLQSPDKLAEEAAKELLDVNENIARIKEKIGDLEDQLEDWEQEAHELEERIKKIAV